MKEKMKVVITHLIIFRLLKNSEEEKKIFNALEIFAPEQMKLKIDIKLSKYKGEKKEKLEKKVKKLYESITFISFTPKENETDIYELYFKVLKKVKARWIWDINKYKEEGSALIPYYDSDGILDSLEEDKEEKIVSNSSKDTQSTTHPAPPIEWLTKEEWSKKEFDNLDNFHLTNNYLHHIGLLCLSDGKRYYLNEDTNSIERGYRYIPVLKEPKLPKLVDGANMETWYIQHPREEDTEVIVEKSESPINNYWEFFIDYNERIEEYLTAYKDFTKCLYINYKEKQYKVDEDEEEYEFITLSQAIERCHIPNNNNHRNIKEFKKNKSIFEIYLQIFHEYGEIIIIGDKTFLASGLHRILYLPHAFEKYEEYEDEYKKYKEIPLKKVQNPS